jgi:predicted nucleic acid-binding protein
LRVVQGKSIALCPITELGFVRVSTGPGFNAAMGDARKALADFSHNEKPEFVSADIRALDGHAATTSSKTTDWYLANLAQAHHMKLATFDAALKHETAELVV